MLLKRLSSTFAVATLALGLAISATGEAFADRFGKIGGSGAYKHNCTWSCHPRIKNARAQYCRNKAGQKKLVYWESTGGRCGRTEEGG